MADPRAKVIDKFFQAQYNDLFGEYGSPVGRGHGGEASRSWTSVSPPGAAVDEKQRWPQHLRLRSQHRGK